MVYKKINLIVIFLAISSNLLFGQSNSMLFLMDNVPSTRNVNVAAYDDSVKFNFSLPLLSSIQASANSDFLYSNIIKKRPLDGSKFLDVNSFLASLEEENNINLEAKFNILRFGFKVKESYVSFSVDEKINFDVGIKKELFQFLLNGNKDLSNNQSIGGIMPSIAHTREISLGYVRKFKIKDNYLNVGIKPKYYFGLADLNLNNELNYSNENDFSKIGVNVSGDGTFSGPIDITSDNGKLDFNNIESNFEISDYIANTSNSGLGFDFGFNYTMDIGEKDDENKNGEALKKQKLKIDFSLVDIGKINWETNTKKLNYQLAYQYDGFDITNSLDSESDNYVSFGDLISDKIDSIETDNILNVQENQSYSTSFKPKFYLNTSFIFSEKFSAGLLFNSLNSGLFDDVNISVHSSLRLRDIVHLSASYSKIGNMGLGLSLKGGPFQIYVLTDNLLGTTKLASNPYEINDININFGINFVF